MFWGVESTADRLNVALGGRYRIERELGAGGMATVYLAEDLRHKRRVAVKVLKPELAAVLGAERFVQEITTTASLQHPHILPLFDSGTAESFLYYVMPFIEGETLRDKLNRETQFGVDEAVRITREVADALDYAHRRGVIHRDIKPENILLHDGRPMVADFGIALAVSAAAGGRMTETGLSLGTPHYMSPEQATADKEITGRSDIYSLASVLYEMLAGNPPHVGSSAQQIIMKIIAEPVDSVTRYRRSVPPNVAAALARALEKLPADRFDTARAFADALGNPAFVTVGATEPAASVAGRAPSRRAFQSMAVIALAITALGLWGWVRPRDVPSARVIRYVDGLLGDSLLETGRRDVALSPDGRRLAFLAGPSPLASRLLVRDRDQLMAVSIPGSERASTPFFSPDGNKVAFFAQTGLAQFQLKTATLGGGPAVTIADRLGALSSYWGPDGFIYIELGSTRALARVNEGGGKVTPFTTRDSAAGETRHRSAKGVGNNRHLLFIVEMRDAAPQIALADLSSGTHRLVGQSGTVAWYASTGHLVFVSAAGVLMTAPFDLEAGKVTGEPRVIVEGLNVAGSPDADVSLSGTLVYIAGGNLLERDEVVWFNRDGRVVSTPRWTADFADLAVSPDGERVVVGIRDSGVVELWVRQVSSGSLSRLTFRADGSSEQPTWTPDGSAVTYLQGSDEETQVRQRRADGSTPATTLVSGIRGINDLTWSPDGKHLLLDTGHSGNRDVSILTIGTDTVPRPFVSGPANQTQAAVSPDGKWLAYASNESGTSEVYVRPFANPMGSREQVSTNGGTNPGWARNGHEMLYVRQRSPAAATTDSSRQQTAMMSVDVRPGQTFAHSSPKVLFTQIENISYWATPADGSRFVIVRAVSRRLDSRPQVVVVENWFEELKTTRDRR